MNLRISSRLVMEDMTLHLLYKIANQCIWTTKGPTSCNIVPLMHFLYKSALNVFESLLAGKRGDRKLVNAVVPGQLVYITDQLSNRHFQVDTGAAFSILPHNSITQPSGPPLSGPDGRPLACWGNKPVQLVLDGCHFQLNFLLVAVQYPIIGLDFIRAHHLLVDPSSNRLVDKLTYQSVRTGSDKLQAVLPGMDKSKGGCARPPEANSTPSGFSPPSLRSPSLPPPSLHPPSWNPPPAPPPPSPPSISQLLEDFPDLVNPSKWLPTAVHFVQHHIETYGPPLGLQISPSGGSKTKEARMEFEQMPLHQSLGISSSHDGQEGRDMAAFWKLQTA